MKRRAILMLGLLLSAYFVVGESICEAKGRGGRGGRGRSVGRAVGGGGRSGNAFRSQRAVNRSARLNQGGGLSRPKGRALPPVSASPTKNGLTANRSDRLQRTGRSKPETTPSRRPAGTRLQQKPAGNSPRDRISGQEIVNRGVRDVVSAHGLKKSKIKHVARHIASRSVHAAANQFIRRAPAGHCVHRRHGRWWLRFACGFHHLHRRPWVCYPGYWNGWHTCSYAIVPCEGFRYYVGLRCVTIPDVDCLGIESVQPDSPAALAGLRPGDVIMSVNGKPVSSEDVLTQELSAGQLNLEVFREGNESPTSIALLPQRVS